MFDSDEAQEASEMNQEEDNEEVLENYSLDQYDGQESTQEFELDDALDNIKK